MHSLSRRRFLAAGMGTAAGALVPGVSGSAYAAQATPAGLRVQRLSWAGMRLQAGANDLYIDPLLDRGVWGDNLPGAMVPIDPPGKGDRFVLVTHRHPDHFDRLAATRALGDLGTFVCMPDAAAAATRAGFRVRIASLYEPLLLGDFTATAVPASDGYGDPQVSWVVSAAGRRILHGGDTMWHGSWWRIGRQFGSFDAAFLPINGARFGWLKPVSEVPAVLTPEQAVAAALVIGARVLVPIHYGMKPSEDYWEVDSPEAALRSAARVRNVAVQVIPPGGWLDWPA